MIGSKYARVINVYISIAKSSDLYSQIGKKTMFNQNAQEKKSLNRQLKQLLNIKHHYGHGIALDCNRIYGNDMQLVKTQCKKLQGAIKGQRQHYANQITESTNLLINNFLAKVKPILLHYDPKDIYAIFDGNPHKIIWKSKNINWEQNSVPKDEEITPQAKIEYPPQYFWNFYHHINHTLRFLLHCLGIRVIHAPYECDHQIVKLFEEGKIHCAFSNDFDYIDYGVPLVTTFYSQGKGLVIDYMKKDLSSINNSLFRSWVESTRDISDNNSLIKRINLGILCGTKYLEPFKALPLKDLMSLLLLWNPDENSFLDFMKIKRPEIYIPQDYYDSFLVVKYLYLLGTVYSVQNDKLEPLYADMKHYLSLGSRKDIMMKEKLVGMKWNYHTYSPLSYAESYSSLGDKSMEEVKSMSCKQVYRWLYQEKKVKKWVQVYLPPDDDVQSVGKVDTEDSEDW